jgi:uracil-DNA glycosylase family 4
LTPFKKHLAKWSGCERCDLHCKRNKVVHLRGSIPCDMLFIGESPGASENVIGKPFIGPAGRLLDEIIEAAVRKATSRDSPGYRFAFTNLVGCIPLDDDSDKFAEPPSAAIKACSPRLQELVTMCKPKLLVCVGKLPKKWLDKVLPHRTASSVEIVHPAAILRAPMAAQGLLTQKAVVTLASAFEEL